MAKPGEVDWKAIKTEYITTRKSLRKLAKEYDISYTCISLHCREEDWVKGRKDYQAKCVSKATQKSANKEVNRLSRLITATTKAIDVAMEAFEDEKQFNRYIVTENVGGGATETSERIYTKVDTKALKDLTGVLKDLTGLMRDFYNIPTPAQAEAQRIAAERLEMDRKKAEAGESSDTTLEIIGIPEEYKR